jgi:hypothetical protein
MLYFDFLGHSWPVRCPHLCRHENLEVLIMVDDDLAILAWNDFQAPAFETLSDVDIATPFI